LADTGRNWKKLDGEDRIPNRFRGHFPSRSTKFTFANNRTDPLATAYQHGGTLSLSTGKLVGYSIEAGRDQSGLGRWTWQLFRGKGGSKLRIITCYRPVTGTADGQSVHAQHLRKFLEDGEIREPRQAFLDDLGSLLDQWFQQGDQLLVMGDINEFVLSRAMRKFFSDHHLRELIVDRHGKGPATTKSNEKGEAIDGIWGTPGVTIKAGGYLPFDKCVKSDHRALWVKITYQVAFGTLAPPTRKVGIRRLRLNDEISMRKFSATLEKWYQARDIPRRAQRLFDRISKAEYTLTDDDAKEFDRLIKERHEGRMKADEACRRLHLTKVHSSPTVKKAQLQITLLDKLLERQEPGNKTRAKTVQKLARKTGRHIWLSLSSADLRRQRSRAKREYNRLKKSSGPLRSTHYEELAKEEAARGNIDQAKALHQRLQQEKQRERYDRLRQLSDQSSKRGVDRINEDPVQRNPEGDPIDDERPSSLPRVEYDQEAAVVDCALRTVAARSRMSEDRPTMIPPLVNLLQYDGMTPFASGVLNGTAEIPPEVDSYTQRLLRQCKAPIAGSVKDDQQELFPLELYLEDCRRLRERTSSGPSDVTPAMIKTAALDPTLCLVDYHLAYVPWKTGRPAPTWLHGLDLLIYKAAGDNRAEKLRPILLFDIEANMHNKRLGRVAMRKAEEANAISWEQYGSRRSHSADVQALNTRLLYDLLRLNRLPATTPFADLVSNYDLVAHNIASLALQRTGMPRGPIKAMLTTLQDMEHTCRTAFGDSIKSYGGEIWAIPLKPPPQGLGQGNGAAPTIWALVSTPLLETLREEGHGMIFKCNISKDSFHLVGYAFVDDTTLVNVAPSPDWDTERIMKRSQEALDIYVGGVAATGGTVHPTKTKWYLVEFCFDKNGKPKYVENEATLSVATRQGRKSIERLPVSAASRILGVYIAPDGNNEEQVKQLRKKTEQWADRVRSGHLPKTDAWYYLQSTIKRSLLYPLLATTLTEKECKHIEAPALAAGLQAAGLPSNLPRSVVYGPDEYLGMNHGSLYHSQEAKHIQAIMDYGTTKTITGHQIRALIEGHKLEIGLGGPIFEKDWEQLRECVTPTWITDTWRYMWIEGIRLDESTPHLQLLRQNDAFIMEIFSSQGYSAEKLARLNRCRCHLQAVSLADISDGKGRMICSSAWKGQRDPSRPARYVWPLQPSPPRRFWEEWQEALETSLRLDKRRGLPSAHWLGRWHTDASEPSAVEVPSEDRVYIHEEEGRWRVCSKARGRRSRLSEAQFVKTETTVSSPPADGLWASAWHQRDDLVTLSGSAPAISPPTPKQPRSFLERCETTQPNVRWAIESCRVDDDGRYVAQAIREGTALAVSDGSFKDAVGTAGFVVEGPRYNFHRILGDCMVPGYGDDQSAYRSELCGLMGIMYTLRELCAHHHIKTGAITVACDGLSAIRKALDEDSTFSCRSAQFDLLAAIESVLLRLPIQVRWRHVDGHQDDGRVGPLDRWEQLNVEMDALAKLRWQQSAPSHRPFHDIDGQLWPLYIGCRRDTDASGLRTAKDGRAVGNDLPARLADHTLGKHLLQFWSDRPWVGNPTAPRINWDAIGAARAALTMPRKAWLTKFAAGHNGVYARLEQRGQVASALCPRCHDEIETPEHVLSCRYGDPRFEECAPVLMKWGRKSGAAPGLMETIVEGIADWRRRPSSQRSRWKHARSPALFEAAREQQDIGWGAMLMGLQSRRWELIQGEHFRNQGSLRSGRRWVTELIKKLWNTAWDMWSFRSFQINQGYDEEALNVVMSLDRHILHVHSLGTNFVPPELHSLVNSPPQTLLRRPVEARLAWLDKIDLGREYLTGRQAPAAIRRYYARRLIHGGLLARLRRSKLPPPLRTNDRAPQKALLTIEQEEE
jgi:hypothetical protein